MPLISHPLDKDLFFPYVKDDLDAPEKMMKSLIDEYLKGGQEYKTIGNVSTLTRLYEDSYQMDSISSHFTEEIRVLCHQNEKPNYVEIWESMSPEEIRRHPTTDSLRVAIAKAGGAECAFFSPALCLRFYIDFSPIRGPIKIIDPSAGWGDRMISAIAAGDAVAEYDGYDPNPDLRLPFERIMKQLDQTGKCRFFNIPFEDAPVRIGYYDLGVTSPPYFDLEIYERRGKPSRQSIAKNNTYKEWVDKFYHPYLWNFRRAIRPGGRIIIYVSKYRDKKGNEINLEKTTIDIFKEMKDVSFFTKGYLETKKGPRAYPRPFFVFNVN